MTVDFDWPVDTGEHAPVPDPLSGEGDLPWTDSPLEAKYRQLLNGLIADSGLEPLEAAERLLEAIRAESARAHKARAAEFMRAAESLDSLESADLRALESAALSRRASSLSPPGAVIGDAAKGELELVAASSVEPRRVDWLIPHWIPRRGITVLAGQPGAGKTTLALGLAAAVSSGGKWGGLDVGRGRVVAYTGEDTYAEIVAPNLIAAGADMDRVLFCRDAGQYDDSSGEYVPEPFSPAKHMEQLSAAMDRAGDVSLVILDPALEIAAKAKDEYRGGEIRRALEPVRRLAADRAAAVICVTHFVKRHNSTGSGILDRVIGSGAWTQVARMVLGAEHRDPETYVCARVKSSWGPAGGGFEYSIRADPIRDGIDGRRTVYGERLEGTADELLGRPAAANWSSDALDEATGWLRQYFDDLYPGASVGWHEVEAAAQRAASITRKTIRNARERLSKADEIETFTEGGAEGRWKWRRKMPA